MARITLLVVVLLVLFGAIQLEASWLRFPFGRPFGPRPVRPITKNLAEGKKTSQSSTAYGGQSKRAVDGKRLTNWNSASCTHTNNELKPWWKVELGQRYLVSNVKITNRGDCCGSRLSNFDVKVGSNLCKHHPGAVKQGATIDLRCSIVAVGNSVVIQLRGRNYLTLCEVQVFGVPAVVTVPKNLATGKKTSQSSTAWGGLSQRAIDGNKFSNWYGISCMHTNNDLKAWWKVELGQRYLVSNVKVTNRGDCCGSRLSNFDVKVGSNLCKHHPGAVKQGATIDLRCNNGLVGNAVIIQLRGRNYLTFCEVEVFGVPAVVQVPRNLVSGKKTSQSSTTWGGVSQRAIDGNKFSNWYGISCTHTSNSLRPWWQVDLGKRYIVGSVKLTNRGDCCANRLSNFDVKVDNYLCKHHPGAVAKGATITLKCNRRLDGRIVKIQLRGRNYLTLCEVQVFSGR